MSFSDQAKKTSGELKSEGKAKSKGKDTGGETSSKSPPPVEETNLYNFEEEEENIVPGDSLDDDDDEFEEEAKPFFKTPLGIGVIAIGAILIGVIVYFVFIKKDPPPPPVVEEVVEQPDPTLIMKDSLYKMGIGDEAITGENVYDQGPLESSDFRKDFTNTSTTETYKQPINIVAVNDSVAYVKHRTMTDDGMDVYWVEADYKGKKSSLTMPYYIWQTLAPQGTMDVVAEVVTDADGKTFVTSLTPVPPTKE